jgi:hypothetical protein
VLVSRQGQDTVSTGEAQNIKHGIPLSGNSLERNAFPRFGPKSFSAQDHFDPNHDDTNNVAGDRQQHYHGKLVANSGKMDYPGSGRN